MEEIEVPTEHLHEAIHEKAHEEGGWFQYVAISTALMAVLAAFSSLMAGHHSNEALIDQIKASDQWSYYQAKGIKGEIKKLEANSGITNASAAEKYAHEQEEIKKSAEEAEHSSVHHLERHVSLARSVTLFQIAIAISAIAILMKRKSLWLSSLVISLVGLVFFITGLI